MSIYNLCECDLMLKISLEFRFGFVFINFLLIVDKK